MQSCRKQAVIPCQDGRGARTQPCWLEVNAGGSRETPQPCAAARPLLPRAAEDSMFHFPCPLPQSPRELLGWGCSCSSLLPLLPVSMSVAAGACRLSPAPCRTAAEGTARVGLSLPICSWRLGARWVQPAQSCTPADAHTQHVAQRQPPRSAPPASP